MRLQKSLGRRFDLSTTHHPPTSRQSKRTIQTLEDILCCCILDLSVNWDGHLSLVEFTYNNSYQANIGIAPYEALYGRPYKSPLCWAKQDEQVIIGSQVIKKTIEKI